MLLSTIECMQVLSGKLMPVSPQSGDSSAQIFRRNFLEAGGLKYIIDIFQNSTFPLNTNTLIIQDCYVVALSLIKFLLCAPPYPSEPLEKEEGVEEGTEVTLESEGLPSSGREGGQGPHPSLARQMSKTKSVEDEVARLTIEVTPPPTNPLVDYSC